ncbi:MAG TPA: glycosyltransferase [Rhodothermales bacterium]|nr:glycosyltransferase [Rhodothermales bacterium]
MLRRPLFSIILATYNRGRHLIPTIESVLQQTCSDFELLVVGDGCTDETEQVVRSFKSTNIRWINLATNQGSQSFPNNEGLSQARGRWICYLGHDDIWAPDHLERLAAVIESDKPDFAISGCIFHGPADSDVYYITGLFEHTDAARHHFFPPSSIAHRRKVIRRIGTWPDPHAIAMPVDVDLLLRAVRAGLRFASTGRITVHKFGAGHRYLSYLRPNADEQHAILASFDEDSEERVQRIIDTSKREGHFMAMQYSDDYAIYEKGQLFQSNRRSKGISLPPLQPLTERTVIKQSDDPRGLDWHQLEHGDRPFRWSGPNPRPKILIPYTGHHAHIALQIVALAPDAKPQDLSISAGNEPVTHTAKVDADGTLWLCFDASLNPSDYTVITLHTPLMFCPHNLNGSADKRRLGLAVADMILEPH